MPTARRKCSELGCAEGSQDSTGPLGSPGSGPCRARDADGPGVLFCATLWGWWTGLSYHTQSNTPHLYPSLTLPKNAPIKMGSLCFCIFCSELFTLQRLFLSKKIWRNWPEVYKRQFYLKWCLSVALRFLECGRSVHASVGLSLFAYAANVRLHRYQAFYKCERGRESFLMKVKRRLAINFSMVRISPLNPPVVPRNIPRQILSQGTCHVPFPHGPRQVATAFGEWGLVGAQRLNREPDSSWKPPPVSSAPFCFSLCVSPIAWIYWNCFASEIHNHLHKCFTLRGTKANMFFSSVVQNPNAHPRPTSQDLAGFWDMLQLSIENISMKFDELHQLKANNWKQMDPHDKKVEHCRFCMLHLKPCTNTGQIK